MRKIRKDVTGRRFSRLMVLGVAKRVNHVTFWQCKCDCGKETIVRISQLLRGQTKSCGCLQKEIFKNWCGENNPNWKGGKYHRSDGYIQIRKREHANADRRGFVMEHIYIMSEYLGRPLERGETVHHKNGVKSDNRLENLELWCNNHGKGQRIEDLIVWAYEILKKYESITK
jgi:hypothetical protein